MTNIAFTTLVVIVLAFPGYIFRACYFADTFTRQVLPRSWTDDIAKAILYSLPFHVVGILLFEFLQHHGWIKHTLSFEVGFRILTGDYGESPANNEYRLANLVRTLYDNSRYLLSYYAFAVIGALVVGHALRSLVWKLELDVKVPVLFGFRNPWLYTLMGRGQLPVPHSQILVWVDALTDEPTEVPGKTRLYRGLVSGFTTEESGALRDIILTAARRGKLKTRKGKEPEFLWQPINPGDFFVLRYAEIKNINITYLSSRSAASERLGQTGSAE